MVSINKKAASLAAVGAAAAVIGLGISQVARADDATTTTPTPPSTTTSTAPSTQGAPNKGTPDSTAPGNGNGRGWGPGGRHGAPGGPGLGLGRGADLSALANKLGVDETKLKDALKAVREQIRAARTPGQGRPDFSALQDEFATKLAAELGIDASKVKTAIADLRAAHEADEQKAFDDRLAQAVKDGKLTQAEADAVKKAAKAGIIGMHGGPRGRGPGTRWRHPPTWRSVGWRPAAQPAARCVRSAGTTWLLSNGARSSGSASSRRSQRCSAISASGVGAWPGSRSATKTVASTHESASLAATSWNRPSGRPIPATSRPTSSMTSRSAASRALSPGSILPPGSMNRCEPALRTVSSCRSRTRQKAAVTKVVMAQTVVRGRRRAPTGQVRVEEAWHPDCF